MRTRLGSGARRTHEAENGAASPRPTDELLLLTRERAHRNPPSSRRWGQTAPAESEGVHLQTTGKTTLNSTGCQPSGTRGKWLSSSGRSLPQRGTGSFGAPRLPRPARRPPAARTPSLERRSSSYYKGAWPGSWKGGFAVFGLLSVPKHLV